MTELYSVTLSLGRGGGGVVTTGPDTVVEGERWGNTMEGGIEGKYWRGWELHRIGMLERAGTAQNWNAREGGNYTKLEC